MAGYTGSGSGGTTDQINVGDTVISILLAVNFRSNPSGTSLFQVPTGTTMVVTDITSSSGYIWYKKIISIRTGYLRGDCVEKHSGGGSSGSTSVAECVQSATSKNLVRLVMAVV